MSFFPKNILFIGDSITDCGRGRGEDMSLGSGYPSIVRELLDAEGHCPACVNRGVSGYRSRDLLAQYDSHILPYPSELVSVMIGINDVWRGFDSNDPTDVEVYLKNYCELLEKIRADFPSAKIMIIEPFLIHSDPAKECWRPLLDSFILAARSAARKYADYLLPVDGYFASLAVSGIPDSDLSPDGVHPSDLGHRYIARAYVNMLKNPV